MAWYDSQGQAGAEAEIAVDKKPEKPDWKSRFTTPKNVFMVSGSVLLTLLAIVPIWNSFVLLQDSNYVFWAGRSVPEGFIIGCVLIICLYALTVGCFVRKGQSAVPVEQTIMMVANIYITLFGLFLMMVSLPLTHQAQLTYTNLLHRCEYSEQTHRLFEYSQVLQNIRSQPACAKMYSIEDCDGYEEAAPYTTFLKGMENNFRCAGFCYRPPALLALSASGPSPGPAPAPAPAPAALLSMKQNGRHLRTEQVELATDAANEELNADTTWKEPVYPPTLFSDMNFQASCEGMAARDMKNFAGDISQQTFLHGISLVLIAVLTGFLKLLNFCIRK